jgi:signal transduction histidine kinase
VTDLVAANRRSEALAELERMRGVTDDLYKDVRESISDLRTGVTERGLAAALREYVEEYEERHGIPVALEGEAVAEGLRPLAALQLLRIVQEALANVRRHSGAHRASISFTSTPQGVQVQVADDGRGFDLARSGDSDRPKFGLASMRERTESLGGDFLIDSTPGKGTRVVVSVPFNATLMDTARGPLATAAG